MATILYPSPVFGPVHSRRLGLSLGINVCPPDGKICSFDCIYCECGFNGDHRPKMPLPSRTLVRETLKDILLGMSREGNPPDSLTFSGNGEPTGHPEFPGIVDDVLALRDELCPGAKVSVLTNATRITKKAVFEALSRVDNPFLKLDTVDIDYIRLVDRPNSRYDLPATLEAMERMGKKAVVQTMFLHGLFEGKRVDNTGEEFVGPWVEAVARIRPRLAAIYTVARETPDKDLRKATREELDAIAAWLEAAGVPVQVSY